MDPRVLLKKRKINYPILKVAKFVIIKSLALLSLSIGQQAQAESINNSSVSIHMVGVVPVKLEMSFTFTTGNTIDLVGHGEEGFGGFEVSSGASKGLGFMNVKSNLIQGYTITAYSENNGCMKNLSKSVAVPYKINIDGRLIECRNGMFSSSFIGKSVKEGDFKAISLQFAEVPKEASKEVLVDKLVFSISTN